MQESKKTSFGGWLKNESKVSLAVYLMIFIITFVAFINTLIIGDWVKIGLAIAALTIYEIPLLVTIFFKIKLPAVLETTFYLFIFASLILGEVFAFYGPFPFWDVVLHFLSGFVIAGIGLSIIENMNKGNKKSKLLTLLFAFCFSITIGIMWECLEFTFDMTIRTDAQKDTHVNSISTITLQRDGGNRPVKVDNIEKTDIYLQNGEVITIDEGYLDIGLMDTMKDILVNVAGAAVFCGFGVFYLKRRSKNSFIDNFILTKE